MDFGVGFLMMRRPESRAAMNLVCDKLSGISSPTTSGTEYTGNVSAEGFRPITNADVSNTKTFAGLLSGRIKRLPLSEASNSAYRDRRATRAIKASARKWCREGKVPLALYVCLAPQCSQ